MKPYKKRPNAKYQAYLKSRSMSVFRTYEGSCPGTETASRESLATRLIRHRFTQQKFYPKTLEMPLLGIFLGR